MRQPCAFAPGLGQKRTTKQPPFLGFSNANQEQHAHPFLSGQRQSSSSTSMINLFPKRGIMNAVSKAAPSVPVTLLVLLLGYFLGRRKGGRRRGGARMKTKGAPASGLSILSQSKTSEQDEGATPIWLNYGLARLWSLFQKSTRRLITEVLQPTLDDVEKPEFVTNVTLSKFVPGSRAPYFTSLKRLPSRALAEVQYSYQVLFSSRSEFYFDVDVEVANRKLTLPVKVSNMDIDAQAWSALNLAPYEPYCTRAQIALLEPPKVSFDIDVAGVLPLNVLPGLKSFFFKVLSEEVPKQFLYPLTNVLDFTPELIQEGKALVASMRFQNLETMSEDELKIVFAEQWALFQVLDLNNDGVLSPVEIFAGLKDWGYTAQDASESFSRLDVDGDQMVDFSEFCKMWPSIASSFVPSRYQGLLSIFVKGAEDLPVVPVIGAALADPYVEISTFGDAQDSMKQTAETKPDSMASEDGEPGYPIWNEAFELNSRDPTEEVLEIVVREGSPVLKKFRDVIARGTVPLSTFRKRPTQQQLAIPLEPQGSIIVDLSYADFVDRVVETKGTPPE